MAMHVIPTLLEEIKNDQENYQEKENEQLEGVTDLSVTYANLSFSW